MRAEFVSAVTVAGTNSDIRGIIRYDNSTANPTTSSDPGVPNSGLSDLDTTLLAPAIVKTPPTSTKYVAFATILFA